MIISVINQAPQVSDRDLLAVIRAINQQIEFDFAPYWNMPATLRLEGSLLDEPRANAATLARGDAVIYIASARAEVGAEGFHDRSLRGIPYGVVSPAVNEMTGDSWTVAFSHETMELIADPQANNYVMGPSPRDPLKKVFFWFELCDAVSGQTYKIDDVELQNFLLPAYFEPPVPGARTNFLGTDLRPFGIAPKSYVGYYNPETQSQETLDSDQQGKARREIRQRFGHTRVHRRSEG